MRRNASKRVESRISELVLSTYIFFDARKRVLTMKRTRSKVVCADCISVVQQKEEEISGLLGELNGM